MRVPAGKPRSHEFGAMTSMIDVVLFLLMFFVVTGGGGRPALLLPAPLDATGSIQSTTVAPAEGQINATEIWLKLSFEPSSNTTSLEVSGTPYSPEKARELLKTLADIDAENPVILDIDQQVPLGDIVSIYDACQSAGFEKISFAARMP